MSKKQKINFLELTGNLAKDLKVIENATFITAAVYNRKDKRGDIIFVFEVVYPPYLDEKRKMYLSKIIPTMNFEENNNINLEIKEFENLEASMLKNENNNNNSFNVNGSNNNHNQNDNLNEDEPGIQCAHQ